MPLIKLNRINKGGEIVINSEHIQYLEVESKTTTLHLANNLVFSVEEPLDGIIAKIEMIETSRIRNGILQSEAMKAQAAP
jgi:uncharacterized protein YlzI (FlbEa/FlbD family)